MQKKIILIISLMILFYIYPTYALKSTSSELVNRSVCDKLELALANTDGSLTSISCYSDYNTAKTAMNNHESDDTIILEKISGKVRVIDAKYALVYLDKGDKNIDVYTSSSLSSSHTYMNNYANYGATEAAYLGLNYSNKAIKMKISGETGWIKNNTYTIIPLNWVKSSSYYYMNSTSLIHYYAGNIENSGYTQMNRALGPKLDYLEESKRYYSYDGIYFYSDMKTMLSDYIQNISDNSVNHDNAYYNYYMYLPHRSRTNYTTDDIDVYLRNVLNFKGMNYGKMSISGYSMLYGQADYFMSAEKLYGANALSVFSLSRNESANGQSSIAINKNNVFGHNAVDGSAYNSATGYLDVRSSIYTHAYGYISNGYSRTSDWRYYGGHFGNKEMGMNVMYASDPYWGEKAANFYYTFDRDNGLLDYNYYQLAITNNTNINARTEARTNSASPYAYKYKNTPVIILDEVEGEMIGDSNIWYKVQADSNLNSARTAINTSSWATYNWNSYVYVHSSFLTLINSAKDEEDGYHNPSTIEKEPTDTCTYIVHADNTTYSPLIGVVDVNKDYYYSSSLVNKKGTILQGSYVTIMEEAHCGDSIRYLVTTDYNLNQKHWIDASNITLDNKMHFYKTELNAKEKIDVYSKVNGSDIGDIYTNTYLPILSLVKDGNNLYGKIPYKLNPLTYGYIKITQDINTWLGYLNEEPVITASDKTFIVNSEYNLMEGVTASDKEDGNLTSQIIITENTVDITKVGSYTVTYSVTDSFGNTVFKTIGVIVKAYNDGEPLFMYHNLEYQENNTFNISGFLAVKGMDNISISHELIFINQVTTNEYVYNLTNWEDYPYEMSSLDDTKPYNYSGGWFNSNIDLESLPAGDYTIYVRAYNGTYVTNTLFTNIAYANMTRRAHNGNIGYSIEIDYTSSGSPLVFMVRKNNLLSYDVPNTLDPMYNFFNNLSLESDNLTIKGTSHNIGVAYGIEDEVARKIVFENLTTYERYTYDLGSITNGDYPITLAVSDNCDKTRAWYNKTINLASLPSGEYVIYIQNTVLGKTYYGELIDIAYTNFSTINSSKYTFRRVNDRRLRLELVVS